MNVQINGQEQQVHAGFVSVATLYETADCGENRIFLNREDGIDIPLLPEEYLLIHGGEKLVTGESSMENNPRLRNGLQPEFNGSHDFELPTAKISGKALKERDDKFPGGQLFADIEGGVDAEILDDMVIVVQNEDSYFVIPPTDNVDDPIDLEQCGQHKRRPPRGRKYRIRIDGEKHTVDSAEITGTDILALVGKSFGEWSLNQKLCGGKRERIEPNTTVDLARPGIERFEAVRRQVQQGDVDPYELLPEDTEYLEANYSSKWEKITEGSGKHGLLIREFPVPGGYTLAQTTLMVLIPSGYPGSALDMFYFDPPLHKSNGATVNALASEDHFDRTWQRWSRHYKWKPGEDCLWKHIEHTRNEIENEVK